MILNITSQGIDKIEKCCEFYEEDIEEDENPINFIKQNVFYFP